MTVDPDHLLDQARLMIRARRRTDLRRAISNAYYAVFHAILTEVADQIVGKSHRAKSQYSLVYRSIDHKVIRRWCEIVRQNPPPGKFRLHMPRNGFGEEIKKLAVSFVDLQEKRNLADYDPLFRVGKSEVLFIVASAQSSLQSLRDSRQSDRRALAFMLAFPPR
jgi:hypothetical protein